jgi:hypothetical protein
MQQLRAAASASAADARVGVFHGAMRQIAAARLRAQHASARRGLRIALVLAVVLHLVAGWWFAHQLGMRTGDDGERISVRLLDPPEEVPREPSAAPLPRAPLPQAPASRSAVAARNAAPRPHGADASHVADASHEASLPGDAVGALHLLETDGSIRMPAAERTLASKHRELMQRGHNMLHCAPRDRTHGTPEAVANAAGAARATYLAMFHYPGADALLDRMGAAADVGATIEETAKNEARRSAVCDDRLHDRLAKPPADGSGPEAGDDEPPQP